MGLETESGSETKSGSETITQRGASLLGPILETVRVEGGKEVSHGISSDPLQRGHRFLYVWIMVTEGTSDYRLGSSRFYHQVLLLLLSVVCASGAGQFCILSIML